MEEKEKNIPKCIGIIMDGNRRWAKEQGVPIYEGHRKGYEKMKDTIKWSKELGVENLIFYCFSVENWNRVEKEINYLMDLFQFAFSTGLESLIRNQIKVKVAGDTSRLSLDLQKMIKKVEVSTAHFKTTVVFALSYGGREEILNAVKNLSENKTKEEIKNLTEQDFSGYLYTKDVPDPDIIVRTSGEKRLSGFLPWQGIYSELFFLDTNWPAFSKEEFLGVLEEYNLRQRRHGK
jgi:undecaprenyl diphosphate synthase